VSNEFVVSDFEQVARVVGERWARRLRSNRMIGGTFWPGTTDEAQRLLAVALGGKVHGARLEALVSIVERTARAAWYKP
jgi:hypothetical protein